MNDEYKRILLMVWDNDFGSLSAESQKCLSDAVDNMSLDCMWWEKEFGSLRPVYHEGSGHRSGLDYDPLLQRVSIWFEKDGVTYFWPVGVKTRGEALKLAEIVGCSGSLDEDWDWVQCGMNPELWTCDKGGWKYEMIRCLSGRYRVDVSYGPKGFTLGTFDDRDEAERVCKIHYGHQGVQT